MKLRIGLINIPFQPLRHRIGDIYDGHGVTSCFILLIFLDSPTLFSDSICCNRRQLHDSDIVLPWRGVVLHELQKISSEEGKTMPLPRDASGNE